MPPAWLAAVGRYAAFGTFDAADVVATIECANGVVVAGTTLRISSLPPVIFEDTEFRTENWSVTATPAPAVDGPTFAAAQATYGGNPAGYRLIANEMTAGTSSLRLVHSAASATYAPALRGPFTRSISLFPARIQS